MSLPSPAADRIVLVTGATSGIGEALARELARRGHALALTARDQGKLEQLARELARTQGIRVSVHAADLTDDADRGRLVDEVRANGRVVGACNSAGTAAFGRVVDHDVDREAHLVRLDALAVHDLTNVLVRDMVARGAGAILNIASIVAFAPQPHNATYGATKAFVQSFSEALHAELAGTGVSCTVVSPGPTRSAIWRAAGVGGFDGFGGDLLWQDPEDVARDAVEAMVRGRRSVIPGLSNKLIALGYRVTPRRALLPAVSALQSGPVRRLFGTRERT